MTEAPGTRGCAAFNNHVIPTNNSLDYHERFESLPKVITNTGTGEGLHLSHRVAQFGRSRGSRAKGLVGPDQGQQQPTPAREG